MTLQVGSILEGTVVNITNFGAFVDVEGKTGLVHISEISNTYVKNIRDYVKENDKVKVKVIGVDEKGKISLSMKQANPAKRSHRPIEVDWGANKNKESSLSFEDMMSKYLKESEERIQDLKKSQDSKRSGGYSRR